ncbi:hypothetical protein ANANG_G00063720, partial [Anguilla anguilla]
PVHILGSPATSHQIIVSARLKPAGSSPPFAGLPVQSGSSPVLIQSGPAPSPDPVQSGSSPVLNQSGSNSVRGVNAFSLATQLDHQLLK